MFKRVTWLESTPIAVSGLGVGEQVLRFCLHMSSPCTSVVRYFWQWHWKPSSSTKALLEGPCQWSKVPGPSLSQLEHKAAAEKRQRGLLERIFRFGWRCSYDWRFVVHSSDKDMLLGAWTSPFCSVRQKLSNVACLMLLNSVPQHISIGFPPALP